MRTEIAGAPITTAVAYVIEILQTCPDIRDRYIEVIDSIARREILNDDRSDGLDDFDIMSDLRVLQQLRNDILAILTPPTSTTPKTTSPPMMRSKSYASFPRPLTLSFSASHS